MMKRLICFLLFMMICAMSLTAWAQDDWMEKISGKEKNFYHAIDGSTATIPLSEAIAVRRLNITQEQAAKLIHHNTTALAYDSLLNGYDEEYGEGADLIFVTAPSDYELESAKEYGVELEFIPVAHDALVFLNNVRNPVTGLTQQLRDIYTGKITSWKEAGGEDESIIPFQRTDQTVFDGSYPLSVTCYAVLKKGLPKDHPARQLINWLLSDEGQRAVRAAGYAAVRSLDE